MQSALRSRKALLLTIVVAATLCGSVLGYLLSLPPPKGPEVTLTSPPLELSMMLDKTHYSFAENMSISFYLRNISNETVTLAMPSMNGAELGTLVTAAEGVTIPLGQQLLSGLCHFSFTIAGTNGTTFFEFGLGSGGQTFYSIVLQPDASLNQTILIQTKYLDYEQNLQLFQPGAYQITAILYTAQFKWETPSITFTLGDGLMSSSKTMGPRTSTTSTSLQLSMSLDKTEYATSDNLTVYFSLRNISDKTVTVTQTYGTSLGLEPLVTEFKLTTSAEGVSSSHLEKFHFRLIWVDSNGTVVADLPYQLARQGIVYYIVLEPNGSLNQTLYISITDYFGVYGLPPKTGTFQIRGLLSDVWIDGIAGPTVTLETPSIGFTIK
jgi:hypothetical protein